MKDETDSVINIDRVAELGALSRLEFTETERTRLLHDLNAILEHCHALRNIDTEGVEAMFHPSELSGELRADQDPRAMEPRAFLGNAPESSETYYSVPRVVE